MPFKTRNEGSERQGRKRKQLLDDIKDTRGYWKLKAESLDGTLCRNYFGRVYNKLSEASKLLSWSSFWTHVL
jgi:hypothetical protein